MGKPGFIVSEEKLRLLQIERAVERFSGGQTTGGVDEAPSSSGGSSSHIYAWEIGVTTSTSPCSGSGFGWVGWLVVSGVAFSSDKLRYFFQLRELEIWRIPKPTQKNSSNLWERIL